MNITPGICGNTDHCRSIIGNEEGAAEIGGHNYYWFGGCQLCIEDKLEKLRKEANGDNSN